MTFTQNCRKFLYHIILKYTLGWLCRNMWHKVLCLGDASQWMQIYKCSGIGKSLYLNCVVYFLVCIVQKLSEKKLFLTEGIHIIEVIN